jgi:hypothetical protein
MLTPEEAARIERLEHLIQFLLGVDLLIHATASGSIDALGNVTINHSTPNIASITANIGAPTLTVNFAAPFDSDGIYWIEAFIYIPNTITEQFLPFAQTSTQTVLTGLFNGGGPWNFAVFAVSDSL